MIGILEAEREEKKRAKYLEKLRQQNKNPADEEKKKLEFISRFCSKVIFLYICRISENSRFSSHPNNESVLTRVLIISLVPQETIIIYNMAV